MPNAHCIRRIRTCIQPRHLLLEPANEPHPPRQLFGMLEPRKACLSVGFHKIDHEVNAIHGLDPRLCLEQFEEIVTLGVLRREKRLDASDPHAISCSRVRYENELPQEFVESLEGVQLHVTRDLEDALENLYVMWKKSVRFAQVVWVVRG